MGKAGLAFVFTDTAKNADEAKRYENHIRNG
jgi:hypothetical protein